MNLKKLELYDFRNIANETIEFSDGVNVICGMNAQGKTNILESIWIFASGKSFRPASDNELIRSGCEKSRIRGTYECEGRIFVPEITYERKKHKIIKVNDIKIRTSELLGKFSSVIFYPEQMDLVKSGPDKRRRFIDLSVCQIRPRYYDILRSYERILEQRNCLLKKGSDQTLDEWDEKLAALSAVISRQRNGFISELSKVSEQVMYEISGGTEKLDLVYNTDISYDEKTILEEIRKSRDTDFRTQRTNRGAHRDDFSVFINGYDARLYGSQGQQRSCVMAMKLGEAEVMNDKNGSYPLILLDDVFSELDINRKKYITQKIKGRQVIITTCEESTDGGNIMMVSEGKVKCIST